jgi:uncharacterized protein YidB (DUF937 family)
MSLLDQLLGNLFGQSGKGPQGNALLNMAAALIQSYPGGLAGLVQSFANSGMAREASSWVSTGQNLPISAEQLLKALGQGNVESLGRRFAVPEESAPAGLAALLPALIDQLTPRGQIESDVPIDSALQQLRDSFRG